MTYVDSTVFINIVKSARSGVTGFNSETWYPPPTPTPNLKGAPNTFDQVKEPSGKVLFVSCFLIEKNRIWFDSLEGDALCSMGLTK